MLANIAVLRDHYCVMATTRRQLFTGYIPEHDRAVRYEALWRTFPRFGGFCTATRLYHKRGGGRRVAEDYLKTFSYRKLDALMDELAELSTYATSTAEQFDAFIWNVFGVDPEAMVDGMSATEWVQWLDKRAHHYAARLARR